MRTVEVICTFVGLLMEHDEVGSWRYNKKDKALSKRLVKRTIHMIVGYTNEWSNSNSKRKAIRRVKLEDSYMKKSRAIGK